MCIPPVILKGVKATLEVIVRDKNGNPLSESDLMVKISSSYNDITIPNEIKKHKNGKYEVSFIPDRCGDHTISLLVNGNHISGSPYK